MEFRVLGPLEVRADGRSLPLGGRRQRLVLATLLLHANEVVSTDALVDAVWGDAPPQTARKSLQSYVARLRGNLGDHIESQPPGYLLRLDLSSIDAALMHQYATEGRQLLATDSEAASNRFAEALSLWHGSPWGDLADEPILRPEVERLADLYLTIVEDQIEADLSRGHIVGLTGQLEGLVASHPMRERLRGLLMRSMYADGRQAEALRAYQDARQYLATELGIEPSPEMQRLEEQILLQDESLDPPTPAEKHIDGPARRNPYKGLRPFSEADAGEFFGREELTGELVDRIADERFLVVVGPSGSGKSSAVRAGLIPALRHGGVTGSEWWPIASMLPGSHPFAALEAALVRACSDQPSSLREQMRGDDLDLLRAALRVVSDPEGMLILVIDQFEELFLLVDDEAERSRFIRNLVEAIEDPHSPLKIVVTLRADFFDRPLDHPELGELVGNGQVNVLPLSASGLEQAIVRPAASVGVRVEPELVAELVADVANEPGALPLFEFVLTEMFERRIGDVLSLAGYRDLGGLRGALSQRSEQVYSGLESEAGEAARQVFMRLVTLGEGAEDTRRRARRADLEALECPENDIGEVFDRFGAVRLLTFDRDEDGEATVEVAHEALLREWPRLRGWIEDSRSDLRLQRQLESEARQWESANRDADYLLAGSRLALYEEWRESSPVTTTHLENQYLDASVARRDAEALAESERQERERTLERRSSSRLRVLVGVMAMALVVGVGLTIWALDSRSELDLTNQSLRVRALSADSIDVRGSDPELALILALHAVDLAETTRQSVPGDAVEALHWALQAGGIPYPDTSGGIAVLNGPSGQRGVVAMPLGELAAHAQAHVSRGLTSEECRVYFEEGACPRLPDRFPTVIPHEGLEVVETPDGKPLAGTQVTILGPWIEEEAQGFVKEMQLYTADSGIEILYDLDSVPLDVLEKEGRLPDVAMIGQPGRVADFARRGLLMEIGSYLDADDLRSAVSPYVISMGSLGEDGSWPAVDGRVFAAPMSADVKGLIWYPVAEFEAAGYEVPESRAELVELVDQIVIDGQTPWCHGEESGLGDGWPGTDWVEDIVLRDEGAGFYDSWLNHDLPFNDSRIRDAWMTMNDLLLEEGHVYGGRGQAAVTWWGNAHVPLFEDPPGCWLLHQAQFVQNRFPLEAVYGQDYAAFPFPASDPRYADSVIGGATYLIAFSDRPEVREVVNHILSGEFGLEMTKWWPQWISPHRDFPIEAYEHELTAELATIVRDALDTDSYRIDASDLMPPEIGSAVEEQRGAFWEGMIEFVAFGPDNLDQILADIEAAWVELESNP